MAAREQGRHHEFRCGQLSERTNDGIETICSECFSIIGHNSRVTCKNSMIEDPFYKSVLNILFVDRKNPDLVQNLGQYCGRSTCAIQWTGSPYEFCTSRVPLHNYHSPHNLKLGISSLRIQALSQLPQSDPFLRSHGKATSLDRVDNSSRTDTGEVLKVGRESQDDWDRKHRDQKKHGRSRDQITKAEPRQNQIVFERLRTDTFCLAFAREQRHELLRSSARNFERIQITLKNGSGSFDERRRSWRWWGRNA
ncbi:hypothetical protein SISNIDRAFT_464181 [Sistotremastrum niveocremeum HHB9708]|uniref:Uncharacterized protein n=1 Tax=Sistotremastrum niveocremeum HHB9708 TaxID=1314777 RepID=A0A164XE09_9AGAM|nr:hypothetical protein SISNIDRAFT_464181 [Sistotremastrum niveocremeum HHB9708]